VAWLEDIGVIARTAQWIDEFGHRSGNGRGRRTSDNIRLMIDLDEVKSTNVRKAAATRKLTLKT
jgi:hypothetical protein